MLGWDVLGSGKKCYGTVECVEVCFDKEISCYRVGNGLLGFDMASLDMLRWDKIC